MRRTSLDELPQFLNVLLGQIIGGGPASACARTRRSLQGSVYGYMHRYRIKPGITGWGGERLSRERHARVEKMEAREVRHLHIHNWSFWFDMKIVFITIFKALSAATRSDHAATDAAPESLRDRADVSAHRRSARCLAALDAQERRPDEVIVVARHDDHATLDWLRTREATRPDPRRCVVLVHKPGVVAAYNLGIDSACGDVLCFTDDGAAPHP